MKLKIMHTGDVHLGMKFNNYPEISKDLEEARYRALANVVTEADERQCHLLVVAGDLFDKPNMPEKDIMNAIDILSDFSGDAILILPGNHDFDNGAIELWEDFRRHMTGKMVLLSEEEKYDLTKFDLDAAVYPAPCDRKKSGKNKIGWINQMEERKLTEFELGIAHGALAGFSPDMTDSYFKMAAEELQVLNMDIWLLGHSHISYPRQDKVNNHKIFNSGTPEPDGLDCTHDGYAWYIEIQDDKSIQAERITTGNYQFQDLEFTIQAESDLQQVVDKLSGSDAGNSIVRLRLTGRLDQEAFDRKNDYYNQIRNATYYAVVDDSDLKLKINEDVIAEEFTVDSFPYQLLSELTADEDALHIAYELIREVRE
ncbi:MAG: metallophosphoesterase family protein [Bacillota bacterium]